MIEVNRTVSSVGNEYAAKVEYELRFLSRNRHVRRVALLDTKVVNSAAEVSFMGKSVEVTEIVT